MKGLLNENPILSNARVFVRQRLHAEHQYQKFSLHLQDDFEKWESLDILTGFGADFESKTPCSTRKAISKQSVQP